MDVNGVLLAGEAFDGGDDLHGSTFLGEANLSVSLVARGGMQHGDRLIDRRASAAQ